MDDDELNDDEDDEEIEVEKPKPTKSERPSRPSSERKDIKSDEEEPIFKFGGDKKKEEPPKPTKTDIIKPEVSMSDLEAMFNVQPKTESTKSETSTRDKVEEALKEVKAPTPVIKLNVDKGNVDKGNVDKPKIKLNIKPK